jgi:hypothetical protein
MWRDLSGFPMISKRPDYEESRNWNGRIASWLQFLWLRNVQGHDLHLKRLHRDESLGTMKRTATSSERSSTGVAGRPHLDGRFLEYERGKQEGKDETEEEIPCDIYVLRFSLGLGDEM